MNRRQEINKILHSHIEVDSRYDYTNYKNLITAIDEYTKSFAVSFGLFLRENYSTVERWGNFPLENNKWRCYDTDKEFTTEELLNKFLEDYEQ